MRLLRESRQRLTRQVETDNALSLANGANALTSIFNFDFLPFCLSIPVPPHLHPFTSLPPAHRLRVSCAAAICTSPLAHGRQVVTAASNPPTSNAHLHLHAKSTMSMIVRAPAVPTQTSAVDQLQNQSIKNFAASLATAAVIFGIQILVFLLLSGNWKVRRSSKSATEQPTERQSLFHKI
jgi:hypothetical protein